MPLYEYACAGCGARTEKMRKFSERTRPLECPECAAPMAPALTAPGRVSAGAAAGASSIPTSVNVGGCGPGGCGF